MCDGSALMIPGTGHVLMSLMEVRLATMIAYCSPDSCCSVFVSCLVDHMNTPDMQRWQSFHYPLSPHVHIIKTIIRVDGGSSLWRPILTFLVRLQPPVALQMNTAVKEEARQSRRTSKKVYFERWFETDGWVKQTQDFCLCPVWNQY